MSLRDALNHSASVDPLAGFHFCDVEEGATSYFGYCSFSGSWIIKRLASDTTMRYVAGKGGYSDAWTNRASLNYTLPDAME